MPNFCAAFGCSNNSSRNRDKSFHTFPLKDSELLVEWVKALRRLDFTPTSCSRLCSDHFKPNDIITFSEGQKRLKHGVIPSVFDFPSHLQSKQKDKRVLKRTAQQMSSAVVSSNPKESVADVSTVVSSSPKESVADVSMNVDHSYASNQDATLSSLQTRNESLQKKVKMLEQKLRRQSKQVDNLKELLLTPR